MKKVFTLISALLLLVGCSTSTAGVTDMEVLDFSNKINEPGVVTLDVRTPSEFAEGYIEGAINIDFQSGNFEAEIATLDMHDAGFHNVYNLEGGVIDWSNQGMTLVSK
jgi:rhodanese-related sulfurtransferase